MGGVDSQERAPAGVLVNAAGGVCASAVAEGDAAALNEGEELATGSGHAETNIISYMIDTAIDPIKPIAIAAGRPICPPRVDAITNAGVILGSGAR